jgi:O-acetyl-ADP-ribose deacetylase (regulator of RNase III)
MKNAPERPIEIEIVEGDITALAVDAIVNAANSLGRMGGGVAGVIRRKGGSRIEQEAMERAPIPVGAAVTTTAGELPCGRVIHAPTMERPAMRTDTGRVEAATRAALECAEREGISTVALPGMGTGVGRVSPDDAARVMVDAARGFRGRSLKKVILVGFEPEMIAAFRRAVKED